MKKLSVVIITYNEENNIRRALGSVDFADEIVIVDSYSTDRTVEICKEFTKKIHLKEFLGHVAQKNYALSLAQNEWVLSIDADEEVSGGLKDEILKVMSGDDNISMNGYKMPRRAFYLGRWIRHSGWYPDQKVRLVKKSEALWEGIDPSDKLVVTGSVGAFRSDLLHYPYKDFSHNLQTIDKYTTITAKRLFESGRRAGFTDIFIRPLFTLLKKLVIKAAFLDGLSGIVIAFSTAFYTFSKYLKLYELNKGSDSDVNTEQR